VIAFGGTLTALRLDASAAAAVTFVPPFPTYPPETAWMRQASTDIPGLVVAARGRGRVAYLPADLDRRYSAEHLPDHARLLANTVRWAAGGNLPLEVKGTGLVDCHLYEQSGRLILHLVNLTSEATWRAPLDELIRVGPFRVTMPIPKERATPVRGCSLLERPPQFRWRTDARRSKLRRSSIMKWSCSNDPVSTHRGLTREAQSLPVARTLRAGNEG